MGSMKIKEIMHAFESIQLPKFPSSRYILVAMSFAAQCSGVRRSSAQLWLSHNVALLVPLKSSSTEKLRRKRKALLYSY